MTIAAIIAISVLAYLVAGMATAVAVILNEGEPKGEDVGWVMAIVLFWPIVLMVDTPIYTARWIKARRAARREKPKVYSEYDEENR